MLYIAVILSLMTGSYTSCLWRARLWMLPMPNADGTSCSLLSLLPKKQRRRHAHMRPFETHPARAVKWIPSRLDPKKTWVRLLAGLKQEAVCRTVPPVAMGSWGAAYTLSTPIDCLTLRHMTVNEIKMLDRSKQKLLNETRIPRHGWTETGAIKLAGDPYWKPKLTAGHWM